MFQNKIQQNEAEIFLFRPGSGKNIRSWEGFGSGLKTILDYT